MPPDMAATHAIKILDETPHERAIINTLNDLIDTE